MTFKPFIAGNWKMHKTRSESVSLASAISAALAHFEGADVVLCPTFVNLESVSRCLTESTIKLGAQNMHPQASGAFTGEISAAMLKDAKCDYVILGHSERRQLFGETHVFINQKVKAALAHGLIPIFCVGETLAQREANQTEQILSEQLEIGLEGVAELLQNRELIVAYEPVWAIGTGKVATGQEAQDSHAFIRTVLTQKMGENLTSKIRLLYGGSVKADNVASLMAMPDIHGALVGGASLEADSFCQLVQNSAVSVTAVEEPQPLRPTLF